MLLAQTHCEQSTFDEDDETMMVEVSLVGSNRKRKVRGGDPFLACVGSSPRRLSTSLSFQSRMRLNGFLDLQH